MLTKNKFISFAKEAWRPVVLIFTICLLIYILSLFAQGSTYFVFWGETLNASRADLANISVRSTENFNWTFIVIFAFITCIYASELKNKNYRGLVASLSLYGVHWLYEIVNAIIGKASGYALWTVSSESTSLILLVGVSWELSMMFAIAGLAMSKMLPDDPKKKILGMNNRWFFAIACAAFFSIFEIFLAGTPAFI